MSDYIMVNPDCRDGKHASCSGSGWDMDDMEAGIARVLAWHHSRQAMVGTQHKCVKCNEWFATADGFAAHQAAMITPLIAEAQAVALEEAADELNPRGEKLGAYSNWLRARVNQLRSSDE